MPINHEVVYGNMLEKNAPPPDALKSVIRIQGEFRGQKSAFGISEEVLSKHILLVGGTGSGKTNLFYHMVRQLKAKMTADDVMLIFDSKGDFHKKFFSNGDVLIGNSAQYRKQSDKWNLYEEIIADGKDYASVSQNTQEICKSLFAELVEKNSSNPFFPIAARDYMIDNLLFVGDEIPAEAEAVYGTRTDNQAEIKVKVFENVATDRENKHVLPSIDENGNEQYTDPALKVKMIGEVRLELPPNTLKGTPIRVVFRSSAIGLEVTATNLETDESAKTTITTANTMSSDELDEARARFASIKTSGQI